MINPEILVAAKKRAAAKFGVYIHASVFVVVMLLLITINLVKGGIFWAIYPFLGWGFALAVHALVVFKVAENDFYDKSVQAEVDKLTKP